MIRPSFLKGDNQAAKDEDGAISVNWAAAISAGAENESGQRLSFSVDVDQAHQNLFSTLPSIDASGKLTYMPALTPSARPR